MMVPVPSASPIPAWDDTSLRTSAKVSSSSSSVSVRVRTVTGWVSLPELNVIVVRGRLV